MGTRATPLKFTCRACGVHQETLVTGNKGIFCNKQCRANWERRGREAPFRYKQGGYWMLSWTLPGGTKRRQKRAWQFEHRAVWERHHGPIPDGHVVHHLNGDKLDNRIENLLVMRRSDHAHEHSGYSVGKAEYRRRWQERHPEYKARHAANERARRARLRAQAT